MTTYEPITYRKKTPITAVLWDGTHESFEALRDFTEGRFRVREDVVYTAAVHDVLHDTWVKLQTGDHVVRGAQGEFYPIAADVLAETYEVVK